MRWVLLAILALGVIACGESNDDGDSGTSTATPVVTQASQAQVEPTATEAADTEPTATTAPVEPTNTPAPTATATTPAPTATATTPPEPTATIAPPEPVALTGVGQTLTEPIALESGIVLMKMTHDGKSNFIVQVISQADGATTEYAANEIGVVDFTSAFILRESGEYLLDVNADGNWTLDITQLDPASGDHITPPWEQTGTGTQIFFWLDLESGAYRVTGTHDGSRNFIVNALPTEGDFISTINMFNEIGVFEGTSALQVRDDGPHLIHVRADGNWTLKIE